jgi:DNA-binding protein HU-beta
VYRPCWLPSLDFYREINKEKLAEGKELQLLGFGTFYTRVHKGGKGLNFKTKQKVEYKALRQAAFRPGALLKQAVRRKKGLFGH